MYLCHLVEVIQYNGHSSLLNPPGTSSPMYAFYSFSTLVSFVSSPSSLPLLPPSSVCVLALQLAVCLDFALLLFLLPCCEQSPPPSRPKVALHIPSYHLLLSCTSPNILLPPPSVFYWAVQGCQSRAGPAKLHVSVRGEAGANGRALL